MKMINTFEKAKITLLVGSFILVACGGSGGSSSSEPATSYEDPSLDPIATPEPVEIIPAPKYDFDTESGDYYTNKPYLISTSNVTSLESSQGTVKLISGDDGEGVWNFTYVNDWFDQENSVIPNTFSFLGLGKDKSTFSLESKAIPGDILLPYQWYIFNDGVHHLSSDYSYKSRIDMNVIPLWNEPYKLTGNNVVVTILGYPVDFNHEDLINRAYIRTNDSLKDYANLSADTYTSSTEVAGIISSSFNGKGIRGIAYNSKLYSLNPLANSIDYLSWFNWIGELSDMYKLLDTLGVIYDTSSPSFGVYFNDLDFLKSYSSLAKNNMILISGVGDNNLPNDDWNDEDYHFDSTYNSSDTDYCKKEGTSCLFAQTEASAVNPYGIIVSAVGSDGQKNLTTSSSSAVWVSGLAGSKGVYGSFVTPFSSKSCAGFSAEEKSLLSAYTTDNDCLYTDMTLGSDAASAQIAGLVALMTERNAKLKPHQVKYILASASRNDKNISTLDIQAKSVEKNGVIFNTENGWVENKAGLRFSSMFGFGIPDAKKVIDLVDNCDKDAKCLKRADLPHEYVYSIDTKYQNVNPTCDGGYVSDKEYYYYICQIKIDQNIEDVENVLLAFNGDWLQSAKNFDGTAVANPQQSLTHMQIEVFSPSGTAQLLKPYNSVWFLPYNDTDDSDFYHFASLLSGFYQENIKSGDSFEIVIKSDYKLNIAGSDYKNSSEEYSDRYEGNGKLELRVYGY